MSTDKTRLTTYVSAGLEEQVRIDAEKQGLSVAAWMRLAMIEKLKKEEKK